MSDLRSCNLHLNPKNPFTIDKIFPSVVPDMSFEVGRIITRIAALIAFVRFFPGVLLDMCFEVGSLVA